MAPKVIQFLAVVILFSGLAWESIWRRCCSFRRVQINIIMHRMTKDYLQLKTALGGAHLNLLFLLSWKKALTLAACPQTAQNLETIFRIRLDSQTEHTEGKSFDQSFPFHNDTSIPSILASCFGAKLSQLSAEFHGTVLTKVWKMFVSSRSKTDVMTHGSGIQMHRSFFSQTIVPFFLSLYLSLFNFVN